MRASVASRTSGRAALADRRIPQRLAGVARHARAAFEHLDHSAAGSLSVRIVGVCTAAFVAITAIDLAGLLDRDAAIGWLGLSVSGLWRHGRIWQLCTAPLVHANAAHLAWNMLALWMFGPDVEAAFGRHRYVALSIVAGATASAAGLAVGTLLHGPVVLCGYSGVVFGLVATHAIRFPTRTVLLYGFPLRARAAAGVLLAIEAYAALACGDVGSLCHLAGALGAWAFLRLPGVPERPRLSR